MRPQTFALAMPADPQPSDPSDISDAGIDQDVQAIDAQLQGLDSDVASSTTPPSE